MKSNQYKTGFDVIGDVHADALTLRKLLTELGYVENAAKGFYHPSGDRQALFVGDYINKGAQNLESISIVHKMMTSGAAIGLMGNNEFNHIYSHQMGDLAIVEGSSFSEEVEAANTSMDVLVDQFKQLKLYYTPPTRDFIAVHAQYKPSQFESMRGFVDNENRLRPNCYEKYSDSKHPLHETFMKSAGIALFGTEVEVPNSLAYKSRSGEFNNKARLLWWESEHATLSSVLNKPANDVTDAQREDYAAMKSRDSHWSEHFEKPDRLVFCGHIPRGEAVGYTSNDKVICLDTEEGIGAYRYNMDDRGVVKPHRIKLACK